MKIIISPAKKMVNRTDLLPERTMPLFLEQTKELVRWMRTLTYAEAKNLWRCNDSIARLNYGRVQEMDLGRQCTPALLAYEGIQYQYMAPAVLEDGQWEYLQEHLRILSGLYGVLRPLDGVVPYRLEMQAKIRLGACDNLYDFWGDRLYRSLTEGEDCILNLASKEYSKVIERYREPGVQILTCVFGEEREGRVLQKGTLAKMARGEMVRYLACHQVTDLEELKNFSHLGYRYREDLSGGSQFTFVCDTKAKCGG